MGLTIHYEFYSASRSRSRILDIVTRLRERALSFPFDSVGKLTQACCQDRVLNRDMDDPKRILMLTSSAYIMRHDRLYSVEPQEVIGFITQPGDGCEPARFGFCRYPTRIEVLDPDTGAMRTVTTGLPGWRWSTFCKTQYAADLHCGGIRNFLNCHLSVIGVLDCAEELGILASISDESDFWDNRDLESLADVVGDWDRNCADLVERFNQVLRPKEVYTQRTSSVSQEALPDQQLQARPVLDRLDPASSIPLAANEHPGDLHGK